ncbi:MAG: DNA alkylation repair protein [Prevotella sp.]|nr:DNA alkylation repair protein [Prevotella sp.]
MQQRIKEIKQSFRLLMDGSISQSMRDKGVDYHLNWGVTLPRLRQMADEIRSEILVESAQKAAEADVAKEKIAEDTLYDLSIALWKEDIRECKMLATLLMPPVRMLPEVTEIWMDQTTTQEVAEQAAFNLYQYLPYAPQIAYEWIASSNELRQLCGYHILSRLFMAKREPNERGINEFVDQALSALMSPSLPVRKAALQALQHFADLGLLYKRLAQSALRSIDLDIL